jgi:putative transcriptional regulator
MKARAIKTAKADLITDSEMAGLSPLGREIAEGLVNAIRHVRGEKTLTRQTALEAPEPPPAFPPKKVVGLRRHLGMTQSQFARLVNVNVKSVEGWEQGKRKPGGPTRRLLQLFENEKVVSVLVDKSGVMDLRGRKNGQGVRMGRKRED